MRTEDDSQVLTMLDDIRALFESIESDRISSAELVELHVEPPILVLDHRH